MQLKWQEKALSRKTADTLNKPIDRTADGVLSNEPFREVFAKLLADHVGRDGHLEIVDVVTGNMNVVYKLRYAGRSYGARVAMGEYRFKYERGLTKEVFAIALLNEVDEGFYDGRARARFDRLLATPRGSGLDHSAIRAILYYDWSQTLIPHPFFLFEWIEGETLWECGGALNYFEAGRDLARLHGVRFEHHYETLFEIGRTPLDWHTSFHRALTQELDLAMPALGSALRDKLAALDLDAIPPGPACLVHNDYTGSNIICLSDGSRRIIDWDNWVVAAPELDLIKMKYWTAPGSTGLLAPQQELFDAFLAGYCREAAIDPNPARLYAYEHLWLLRTFNFESVRTDSLPTGRSWSPCYPVADLYRRYLEEL